MTYVSYLPIGVLFTQIILNQCNFMIISPVSFEYVILKIISRMDDWGIVCEISFRWIFYKIVTEPCRCINELEAQTAPTIT